MAGDFQAAKQVLIETSYQYTEKVEEQLQDLELLFDEKSGKSGSTLKVSRELVCSELRKQFGGGSRGFESFLIELIKKSGLQYDEEKEEYLQTENSHNPNTFDLLRIAETYQAPKVEFKPKSIRDRNVSLHARFEEDPLRIVFNSLFNKTQPKAVCTKNKDAHSLASYQDAADPFTHHLQVAFESKRDKEATKKTPQAMLEAIIIETEKEHKNTLLVEGVYGIVEDDLRDVAFSYLYSCLIKYAFDEKKSLLFNLSFNPGSQYLPLQFVNYVGWRNAKTVFYEFVEAKSKPRKKKEKFGKHNCKITAITLTDEGKEAEENRNNLEEKLRKVFVSPKGVIESFSEEKRYTDTWWDSASKSEWNVRDGEAYCLEFGEKDIRKEYKRLSGSKSFSIKKFVVTGLSSLILAGGLVALLYQGGLLKETAKEAGKLDQNEQLEERWSGSECKRIGIEEADPLCKVIGDWDFDEKTEFEKNEAVEQYFPLFCSDRDRSDLNTIWGLNFIAKHASTKNKERYLRRILSGDCGNQVLFNLLTYPCYADYVDYLEPLSFCPSDYVRLEIPPDYILNGYNSYRNTNNFMGKILLLARMNSGNNLVFKEGKKMYSKIFSEEADAEELGFVVKYHDLDRLRRFYQMDNKNPEEDSEEEAGNSDEQRGWKHLMRLNTVKLLSQTRMGRAFLEKRFWESKKPEEIISIGRYLLPLGELYRRKKLLNRYALPLARLGVEDSNLYGDKWPGQFRLEECIEKKREVTSGCIYLDCMAMIMPADWPSVKCDVGVHH